MLKWILLLACIALRPSAARAACEASPNYLLEREDTENGSASIARNLHRQLVTIMNIEQNLDQLSQCRDGAKPSPMQRHALVETALNRIELSRTKIAVLSHWRERVSFQLARGESARYVVGAQPERPEDPAREHPAAAELSRRVNRMELLREQRQRACNDGGLVSRGVRLFLDCAKGPEQQAFERERAQVDAGLREIAAWLEQARARLAAHAAAAPPSQLNPRGFDRVEKSLAEQRNALEHR